MNDYITSTERRELFEILCYEASACHACPRMADHAAVLSRRNGTLTPRVLFVGEAPVLPGAPHAWRTSQADASGRRFAELLASIDIDRDEIFFTNAVLCCSSPEARREFSPHPDEVRSCGRFLHETLGLLSPPVVATMGPVALWAMGRLIGQPLVLAEAVGTIIECDDFLLVPLYYPSPRVLSTLRSFEQQKADFQAVREAVEWTTALPA